MTANLFLGVDGGGTHCRARLVDDTGQVLGEGRSGSGNPRVGIVPAWNNIMDSCLQACDQADVSRDRFSSIRLGLGLAGANQQHEQELVLAQASPFGQRFLLTDAHAACLGAFRGEDGAILILGTGSCGVAYQADQFHIVGGWGFPLSDHGSGARIALDALETSLATLDGLSPASGLTDAINEKFAYQPEQYVLFLDRKPLPKEYGDYTPMVFSFAEQKDPIALHIIERQVRWVTAYLDRLIQLGATRIALLGGVSDAIRPYLPDMYADCLCTPAADAMAGAIHMAQLGIGRSHP